MVMVAMVAALGVGRVAAQVENGQAASGKDATCTRSQLHVLFGFLLALLALTLSLWGKAKHQSISGDERFITLGIIALGVFSPLFPPLFAMIAVFVQAIRYVYAVVYRSARDLVGAPVEVVGMVFNIYLLIQVCMFSTCNPCHRPLVMYIYREKDEQLVSFLSNNDTKHFDVPNVDKQAWIILFGVVVCLNIVLIHYIVI